MKISVITPSFNSGSNIEKAILSVKNQNYNDWEHIIIDGGSNDNTIIILQKYPHLHWVSEPDDGQADAMNKGFALSDGEIIVYLNADDYFLPGAFTAVIAEFEKGASFVMGDILVKSPRLGADFINTPRTTLRGMLRHWEPHAFCLNPVGYFYLREVQTRCPFNPDNYESMDLEFLLSASEKYDITKIKYTLGCFEDGLSTKTHQTQIKFDYWRKETFPYIDNYVNKMSFQDKIEFNKERRKGYEIAQAEANFRTSQEGLFPAAANEPNKTLITVIIPTYNCIQFISRAVDSVINQSFINWNIIVVDDCSTDNTTDLFNNKYSQYPNITYIRHEKNMRLGAARNTGIEHATGEYIFFLDSDDWIEPDTFNALLGVAQQTHADVVATGVQKVFETGERQSYHSHNFSCAGGREALIHLAEYRIGSIAWNKLYKLSLIKDNHIKFTEKYLHEDVVFTMMVVYFCKLYVSIGHIYINYFQRKGSIVNTAPKYINLVSYIKLWKDIDCFCHAIGLNADQDGRFILKQLLIQHGANEIIPKIISYIDINNQDSQSTEIEKAFCEIFGTHGIAFATAMIPLLFLHSDSKISGTSSCNDSLCRLYSYKQLPIITTCANAFLSRYRHSVRLQNTYNRMPLLIRRIIQSIKHKLLH